MQDVKMTDLTPEEIARPFSKYFYKPLAQPAAERVAAIFGFITFVFGLGQVIGPFLAGLLAETTGSFAGSFLMAAVLALTAVFLSAFLPKKH